MSRSPITIEDEPNSQDPADWLENEHAGQIVKLEFFDPLDLTIEEAARLIGETEARLADVVEGRRAMDGELDLRLARYFGMSPGFFLGLQVEYELLEARRALNGELDRIVPRAAAA